MVCHVQLMLEQAVLACSCEVFTSSITSALSTSLLLCPVYHQPWRAFKTDGVIFFSDILTPLPALGIEFDVIKGKGPRIESPIRSREQVDTQEM